jgi:hypothetical protein
MSATPFHKSGTDLSVISSPTGTARRRTPVPNRFAIVAVCPSGTCACDITPLRPAGVKVVNREGRAGCAGGSSGFGRSGCLVTTAVWTATGVRMPNVCRSGSRERPRATSATEKPNWDLGLTPTARCQQVARRTILSWTVTPSTALPHSSLAPYIEQRGPGVTEPPDSARPGRRTRPPHKTVPARPRSTQLGGGSTGGDIGRPIQDSSPEVARGTAPRLSAHNGQNVRVRLVSCPVVSSRNYGSWEFSPFGRVLRCKPTLEVQLWPDVDDRPLRSS